MSALVNLTRKTTSLQGFQLATRDDLWTAYAWLLDNGYTSANINGFKQGATVTHSLSFSDTHGGSQTGYVGDWLVLENGAVATIYTAAIAATMFTVV